MRNYLYLIIAAVIYFSLKEGFELTGIGWAIACGAVAGGVTGAIGWLVEKKFPNKDKQEDAE